MRLDIAFVSRNCAGGQYHLGCCIAVLPYNLSDGNHGVVNRRRAAEILL